jgi:hypothetical protein
MGEADFWVSLEYRLCREFAGMANWDLRHLWCDGLIPERYQLGDSEPRITGRAWICHGQRQEEWNFTLLPPENVTRWLALNLSGKLIQIEPGAAVPDPH